MVIYPRKLTEHPANLGSFSFVPALLRLLPPPSQHLTWKVRSFPTAAIPPSIYLMVSPVLPLEPSLRATAKSSQGFLQLPPDDCVFLAKIYQHLSYWGVLSARCLADQCCLIVSLCLCVCWLVFELVCVVFWCGEAQFSQDSSLPLLQALSNTVGKSII